MNCGVCSSITINESKHQNALEEVYSMQHALASVSLRTTKINSQELGQKGQEGKLSRKTSAKEASGLVWYQVWLSDGRKRCTRHRGGVLVLNPRINLGCQAEQMRWK